MSPKFLIMVDIQANVGRKVLLSSLLIGCQLNPVRSSQPRIDGRWTLLRLLNYSYTKFAPLEKIFNMRLGWIVNLIPSKSRSSTPIKDIAPELGIVKSFRKGGRVLYAVIQWLQLSSYGSEAQTLG